MFQINIEGQYGSKYTTFPVTIGNSKEKGEVKYDPKCPLVEYHQKYSNSCYFSSSASALTAAGEKFLQGILQCK